MHPDAKLSKPKRVDGLYPLAVAAPFALNDPGLQKR